MSDSKGIIKNHIDGGTYRVLAFAETRNRWGVAVTEWTTYKGQIVFQTHRVSAKNQMMALGTFDTEAEARGEANKLYFRDK
ncbi:hypothetical protein [Mycobacteroides abscessus]|uniref:hypothetical protein n=1 Tax=Mycobacteroides abscessus TaxID=36809 RepID=UPI0021034FF5|nr:hypothetical protein [Mycobacteroides abscessus]